MYTEEQLRLAFKAGWAERNRDPGLRRRPKRSFNNAIMGAIGGGRYAEQEYVPDTKTYHHSIWLNSAFRKALTDA